jgi:hypothetical protein
MKNKITVLFVLTNMFLTQAFSFTSNLVQHPAKLTENQKIESLIAFIARQDGVFVRNGSEYTPAQAAEHLRMKWKKGGGSIKTAADFIEKLASTSSISGKPYQIRFKNGKSAQVGPLLRLELARLEKG